jgi:hypothetical protein
LFVCVSCFSRNMVESEIDLGLVTCIANVVARCAKV